MSRDDGRTLHVRVGDHDRTRRKAREQIAALDRGDPADDLLVLDLADYDSLATLFRETNLDLLEALVQHRPESIRATAELVGRDYKEVHRNLSELETLGVVRFEDAGASKRPVVGFDAMQVSVSLAE